MFKSIQKGIPTVMIKGAGETDFYGNFPGILNFGEMDKIMYQLENQQRDIEYLEYVMRGSSDYTSTEKYVDEIKKLVWLVEKFICEKYNLRYRRIFI